jgi:hypothetical protein
MRLAFMALALLAPAAQANLLLNGSFEAVSAAAPPHYVRSFSSTPGWTQFGDGVDLIHNDYEQPSLPVLVDASDGVQFLDMNQAGALGGVWQVVAVTAGTAYHLTLDASAWATNSRGGTLGYALFDPLSNAVLASASFSDAVGGSWAHLSLDAIALSDSLGVRIEGLHAAQAGMGLDNVVLAAAVPEPATWALWLAGMAALGAALRRRR